jgi:hypothetical protein
MSSRRHDLEEEEVVVDDVITTIDETLNSNRNLLNKHRSKFLSLLSSYDDLRREEREERRSRKKDFEMRRNVTRDLSAISSLELAKLLQKGNLSEKTKELMTESLYARDREDRNNKKRDPRAPEEEDVDESVKRILKESWKELQDVKSYLGSYLDRASKRNTRVETKRKSIHIGVVATNGRRPISRRVVSIATCSSRGGDDKAEKDNGNISEPPTSPLRWTDPPRKSLVDRFNETFRKPKKKKKKKKKKKGRKPQQDDGYDDFEDDDEEEDSKEEDQDDFEDDDDDEEEEEEDTFEEEEEDGDDRKQSLTLLKERTEQAVRERETKAAEALKKRKEMEQKRQEIEKHEQKLRAEQALRELNEKKVVEQFRKQEEAKRALKEKQKQRAEEENRKAEEEKEEKRRKEEAKKILEEEKKKQQREQAMKALEKRKKEEEEQRKKRQKEEEEEKKKTQQQEQEPLKLKITFNANFEKRLQDLFDAFDLDSNHKLTFTELSCKLGDEWASWYMEQMDGYGDRDGSVSSLEFRTYFQFLINSKGEKEAIDVLSHFVHALKKDEGVSTAE